MSDACGTFVLLSSLIGRMSDLSDPFNFKKEKSLVVTFICNFLQVHLRSSRYGMEGERYFWKDSVHELCWLQAQI